MAFPETRWTMLAEATLHGDAAGRAALEELCRRYWPPVRDFLCARGLAAEDAEDVAQEFFAGLLKSGGWQAADRSRGRFRSFLMGGVERTLISWRRRAMAAKRGGGARPETLDEHDVPAPAAAAEELAFDSAWAERVMEVAMDALEQEFETQGRGTEFAVLLPFLSQSSGAEASAAAAAELGIGPTAIKSKIFRLRQRFRDCILAEVSRTVETPHEAEEEMAYLFRILSRPAAEFGSAPETDGPPPRENQP